jgi:hypothetical protein
MPASGAVPMEIDSRTLAWILYAIDLAAGKAPASLTDMSAAADAINHAVPTHQEMSRSLRWLQAHGLVEQRGKFHALTEVGHGLLGQARGRASTVSTVWSRLAISIKNMSAGA